jgi:hypothetical protein
MAGFGAVPGPTAAAVQGKAEVQRLGVSFAKKDCCKNTTAIQRYLGHAKTLLHLW